MLNKQTTFKPDSNIEGVSPQDIMDGAVQVRHVDSNIPFVLRVKIGADNVYEAAEGDGIKIFDKDLGNPIPFAFRILNAHVYSDAEVVDAGVSLTVIDDTDGSLSFFSLQNALPVGGVASLESGNGFQNWDVRAGLVKKEDKQVVVYVNSLDDRLTLVLTCVKAE